MAAELTWGWIEGVVARMQSALSRQRGIELMLADRDGQVLAGPAGWPGSRLAPERDLTEGGVYVVGTRARLRLARDMGWFYDAHRAEMDCHALLAVLATPLPKLAHVGDNILPDRAEVEGQNSDAGGRGVTVADDGAALVVDHRAQPAHAEFLGVARVSR